MGDLKDYSFACYGVLIQEVVTAESRNIVILHRIFFTEISTLGLE